MRLNEFLQIKKKAVRNVLNAPRRIGLLSLGIVLLLACASACAPSNSGGGSDSGAMPELTDEIIRERINETRVWDVPEENGAAEQITWNFDEDEPKEIAVVEKKVEGVRATIVLDIKTRSAPNRRNPRSLAGQIRTEWELKTGWALRRWEIIETQNISMKYKNLPKPPATNSNR